MPHPDGGRDESDAGARANRRGMVPGVLLVVIAGLAYFSVRNLAGSTDGIPGPGSLPRILSAILFVLGAVVAIEGLIGRRVGGA